MRKFIGGYVRATAHVQYAVCAHGVVTGAKSLIVQTISYRHGRIAGHEWQYCGSSTVMKMVGTAVEAWPRQSRYTFTSCVLSC